MTRRPPSPGLDSTHDPAVTATCRLMVVDAPDSGGMAGATGHTSELLRAQATHVHAAYTVVYVCARVEPRAAQRLSHALRAVRDPRRDPDRRLGQCAIEFRTGAAATLRHVGAAAALAADLLRDMSHQIARLEAR